MKDDPAASHRASDGVRAPSGGAAPVLPSGFSEATKRLEATLARLLEDPVAVEIYLSALVRGPQAASDLQAKHGRKRCDTAFVKAIPLTGAGVRIRALDTQPVSACPRTKQYGVGSAGFGVFRELASHIRTTEWVLNQSVQSFRCLYHWRVMPPDRSRGRSPASTSTSTRSGGTAARRCRCRYPARDHGDNLTKAPHGVARR